jgi:acetyl-CoA acetyltransferase
MQSSPIHIAGVAETALGKVTDQTEMSMLALAAREALVEAGMTFADVDGLFVRTRAVEPAVEVAEYLGILPRYVDSTDIGGCSFESFLHHAFAAVSGGFCEVALIAYASRQRSMQSRSASAAAGHTLSGQFEAPYAPLVPIGNYAMIAARHMYEYGTTTEQLAEVAVAARRWAQLNPLAWSREPLTIDEVASSPVIADPLRRLDCCLVTDGGGAVVVTTRERARDAAKKSVRVLASAERVTAWHISQVPDLTVTPGAVSAKEAFGKAGVTTADVDLVELYDNFTIATIIELEDLGFCNKGEGGAFVSGGRIAPGGALPVQTMGGGLSYNHPGMLGLLLIVEAVRQLRGEAGERQVKDARIGIVHGIGGVCFGSAGTLVLAAD